MGTKKNFRTRTSILNAAIFVGSFCPHNVEFPHRHTHTFTVVAGDYITPYEKVQNK